MKNNRGVSMITVVITIVVILILALIAFGRSDQLIGNTDYSKFVNNVNEVGFAFDNASVDIQGSSMLVNNKKRDEQIYNFIAKGGEKEKDFLVMSKVPDYTIIQDSADIGMDLPEMKIESGTGKLIAAQYVTTKMGKVFVWPPFEHEGKLHITDTDTVDHKMQTNITVGGENIVIELDPIWGSIVDIVIEQEEVPDDYEEPEEEGHEHDFSAKEATEFYFFAEATCTTSEKYYYKCLYCEEKGTQTYNWGNPLDHIFGEFEVVSEGNCGGAGSKKRACTRCGFSEFVSIPKNSANHVGGEVSEMKTPASCVTAGVEEIKCKTCNVVFRTNNLDKDLNNHVGGTTVKTITAPTCTTTGTQVEKCNSCEKILNTETLDALGHSWGEFIVTVTPNCGNAGTRERTCSTCNAKETAEIDKDLTNHSGGGTEKEIVDATCTKDGEIITKCTRCKATLSSSSIAKKGHSYTNKTMTDKYLKSEATCIATQVYYYKCASCDASAKDSATPEVYTYSVGSLDKTNHVGTVQEHYTAPTSTTDGRKWTTCSACGTELSSEVIPCTGAIAIYSDDDKSLRFYKNADLIVAGTAYNGRTVTHIYTGFEEEKYASADLVPWSAIATKVTSVSVNNEISPISIAYWFENFVNASTFDVEKINTANTTNMLHTFNSAGYNVSSLKITGLNNWDVRKVTYMSEMFQFAGRNATTFDIGDLSGWKTSSLTHTLGMFYIAGYSAEKFDIGNLDNWDTSKVTNMGLMFYRAGQSAKTWNVGNLSKWNTSSAIQMTEMFRWAGYSATTFDIGDLSGWNTSNVTNMASMFSATGYSADTFDIGNLDNWDTSKVTNMTYMFSRAGNSAKTWNVGNLSNWKTSNVTNMSYMFHNAGYSATTFSIGNLDNWDTSKVTNMTGMFAWCGYKAATFDIGNLSKWNTSNVTNMLKMFDYAGHNSTPITLDLSGWETSKVTYAKDASGEVASGMLYMLENMYRLQTITLGENFSTTGDGTCTGFTLPVIDRNYFTESDGKWYDVGTGIGYEPDAIPTNKAATYSVIRPEPILAASSTWFDQGGTTINRNQISSITIVDTYDVTGKTIVDQWDASQVSEGANDNIGPVTAYVENDGLGKGTYKLTLAGDGAGKVYANPDSSFVFGTLKENSGDAFINMISFNGGEIFDTSKATTMERFLTYAKSLENIDVGNWDISNVTSLYGTFGYCYKVKELDVGNWDTSKVINMYGMFQNCIALTELDVATKTVTSNGKTYTAWDVSKVENFRGMFASTSNEYLGKITKLEVENWNTSSAINMSSIFNGCASLTKLDLSNWDVSKVTDMSWMFADCINMKEYNFSGWNTESLTRMTAMFNDNKAVVTLDMSDFDTQNVEYFSQMFELCTSLEEIKGLENWDTSSLVGSFQMFSNSNKLTELDLSSFDTSKVTGMGQMFMNCSSLETIYVSDKWNLNSLEDEEFIVDDTNNTGDRKHIFMGCNKLVGGAGTSYTATHLDYTTNEKDYIYAHIDEGSSNPGYLTDISKPKEPILAASSTWFDQGGTTINRNQISSVTIADSYNTIGKTIVDQWDASMFSYGATDDNGSVTAYVEDDGLGNGTYKLTLAGNGSGKIYANPDSSFVFGSAEANSGDTFTNMTTFNNAEIFDTSRVTTFERGFTHASKLESINVSNWDTSNVTNLYIMFGYCTSLKELNLTNWDVSQVTNMRYTFGSPNREGYLDMQLTSIGDTSNWDTSKVTTMRSMFQGCTNLTNVNVENWNTSNVTDMAYLFRGCEKLNELKVENWNTSNVTTMESMFEKCKLIQKLDLENWDTSKVTDMSFMFSICESMTELNVESWDTSEVQDMSFMFFDCKSIEEIDFSWDTSKVTNMSFMFVDAEKIKELDLSSFDTQNVVNMGKMFHDCDALEKIYVSDKWNISKLSSEVFVGGGGQECPGNAGLFLDSPNLVGGAGTKYADNHLDYSTSSGDYIYAHIDEGSSNPGYLADKSAEIAYAIYSATDNSLRFYKNTDFNSIAVNGEYNGLTVTDIYMGFEEDTYTGGYDSTQKIKIPTTPWFEHSGDILTVVVEEKIKPKSTSCWFMSLINMSKGDFTKLDTSNVTNMEGMFQNAGKSATTWDMVGLSNWDTSSVTNMSFVFADAGRSATTFNLDLSGWDTSSVKDMSYMFYYTGYSATTWNMVGLSNWDTSSATNMSFVFADAGGSATTFDLDLSDWDISSATNIVHMFYEAGENATTWNIGNLSNWDTSKVTDMSGAFWRVGYSATTLDLDLNNWDTSKVTDMSFMFYEAGYGATTWNIDGLSAWDTSSVTNMTAMFYKAGRSATTFEVDLSAWDTSNVTDVTCMFEETGYSAKTWKIGNLSDWDTSSIIDMTLMFCNAGYTATTWDIGDLSNWDISNVTSMHAMFKGAGYSTLTFDISYISNWNTSSVTNMSDLFDSAGCSATTWSIGDLTSWNVGKVTNMSEMFRKAGYSVTTFDIGNLSNWDTSSVTNMSFMFYEAGYNATAWNIGDLKNWDTSKVTNMYAMFLSAGYNTSMITLNLSGWDTSKISDITSDSFDGIGSMFWDMRRLHTITLGSNFSTTGDGTCLNFALPTIDTSYFTESDGKWYDVTTGIGYEPDAIPTNKAATYTVTAPGAESFAIYSATDNSLRFYKGVDVPTAGSTYNNLVATNVYTGFEDVEYATDSDVPWYANRENIKTVVVENVISSISTDYWFHGFLGATSMDLAKLDTSETVTMHSMFYQAGYNTNDFELTGLENWDTSKVQWMNLMFSQMGYNTTNFVLDLSAWDTSDVEYMSTMFYMTGRNSNSFSLIGLNGWNTSSLYATDGMFGSVGYSATTWSIGDLTSWNVTKVTDMSGMFSEAGYNAREWNIGTLSSWTTTSLLETDNMFSKAGYNSSGIILNLSKFNTSKATNMTDMFSGMRRLEKITLSTNFNFKGAGSTSCTLPAIDTTYFTDADGNWYNMLTKTGYAPTSVPNKTAATYINIKLTTGGDYDVQNKCPKCGATLVGGACPKCNASSV